MSASIVHNIYKTSKSYDLDGNKKISQARVIASQVAPVMVKNLLLISYGTTIGYPTILIPSLSSCSSSEEICLSELQISWIGSILLLSSAFGSLISGVVSQIVGRRITMQVCSFLIIISWIIFKYCNDVWQIYFSLAISGLAGGLLESPVLTYVAEICQPRTRGSILPLGSLSSNIGIVSIFALGSTLHWRTVTLYIAIIPISSLILLFFVPESPYWLISKNNFEGARKSLARLRGWTVVEKVEDEFQELMCNRSEKSSSWRENCFNIGEYKKREFIHPYLLILCLFVCYNFSGSQTIPVYAVKIFQTMEVPINEYNATIFLGLSQLLGCLTCVFIIRYTGKRVITFFSITVAILSVVTIGAYAYLTKIKYLYAANEVNDSEWLIEYNWIPLVCIFFAAFAIDGGIRTVVWSLLSECFPMNTRAVATGSMGALSYLLGFTANKTFLELINAITFSGVLWFYGTVGSISLVVIYIWMPETEAKSLQQITDHFSGKCKLGRSVR